MKKLIVFLACIAFSYSLNAQCFPCPCDENFTTPAGSSVEVRNNCETVVPNDEAIYEPYYKDGSGNIKPGFTKLTNASSRYNCHGYAWLIVGSNSAERCLYPKDFYGQENILKFIRDGSYTRIPYYQHPAIVFWGTKHSAITTEDSTIVKSKWDRGPLMQHPIDDHPWAKDGNGVLEPYQYYVRTSTIPIVGPNNLCTSATYSINISSGDSNDPNRDIEWEISPSNTPYFKINSVTSDGRSATVVITSYPTPGATCTLRAKVNGVYVINKPIAYSCTNITGDAVICNNGTPVQYTVNGSVPFGYTWSCSSNLTADKASDNSMYFKANNGARGAAWVKVKNSSGVELASFDITITNCTTVSISSGPTLICHGTSYNFTASLPSGYYWDCSPTLFNIPGSKTGSSVSVMGGGSTGYYTSRLGWVSVRNSSGVQVGMKYVWYDLPLISKITADPSTYVPGGYYRFDAVLESALSSPNYYNWEIGPNYPAVYFATTANNWVYFTDNNYENYLYIYCWASNACGTSPYTASLYLQGYRSPSPAYPNPASDILTIEIDDQAVLRAQARSQTTTGAQRSAPDPTFDIRLYDGMGNILRQQQTKGGTVEFNVSGLPNGTYYLHIYDGVSDKPEVQQIMVQH